MDQHNAVPILDLAHSRSEGEQRNNLLAQIRDTCENTGFMIIRNHGLSEVLVENCWKDSVAFFDSPLENRLAARAEVPAHPYCYHPMEAEALAQSLDEDTPPDLKETFNIGPIESQRPSSDESMSAAVKSFVDAQTIWPAKPETFKASLESYYHELRILADHVMSLFALSLYLPEDYFSKSFDNPMSAMRVINYPELTRPPLEGQWRAGAHTDYGTLTLLLQQNDRSGLQVFSRGEWHDVPAIPGTFVVNIGDLMSRWTNNRWVSTLHRVATPDMNSGQASRRQSVVFFHTPNWDSEIRCIPTCLNEGDEPLYVPVLAGPHLAGKFMKTVQY